MSVLALWGVAGCGPSSPDVTTDGGGGGAAHPRDRITWVGEIASIFEGNCVRCHASGRLATYVPLQTHAQVLEALPLVGVKVASAGGWGARMPPYPGGALSGVCEPTHAYGNDLRLPDAEVQVILRWIADGAPEGEGPHPPEPLAAPRVSPLDGAEEYPFDEGYEVSIDESHETGHRDEYVCVIVDPGTVPDARLLGGVHLVAAVPQVFWGAVVWLDEERESLRYVGSASPRSHGATWYDCASGPGFEGDLVGAFLPEGRPVVVPPRAAVAIPGDALFVVRMHYHSHHAHEDPGDTTPLPPVLTWRDHSPLFLRWVDPAEVERTAQLLTFGNSEGPVVDGTGSLTPPFEVPVRASGHVESMVTTVPGGPGDAYAVWAVQPELRSAGTAVAVSVTGQPPAASECLGAHPAWDVRWQVPLTYDTSTLDAPIVHGGDTLRVDCTYDSPSASLTLLEESCRAMVGLLPVD